MLVLMKVSLEWQNNEGMAAIDYAEGSTKQLLERAFEELARVKEEEGDGDEL